MKRFKVWKFTLGVYGAIILLLPDTGEHLVTFTAAGVIQFVCNLIPVFLCIGLLDVWVSRERLIQMMGTGSDIRGHVTALLAGMATAVPIYALLPIAGILLKKGCGISNILIFLCSSASIRIPLVLFEASFLGTRFALCRFFINLLAVFMISFFVTRFLNEKDRENIYLINQEKKG